MKYRCLLSVFASALLGAAGFSQAQPVFSKSFSPGTIGPGSSSTLTFTIDNRSSSATATDVAFTAVLPAGVSIASPAHAEINGGTGTLSAPDGGSSIALTEGRVFAYGTCTLSVDVTGSAVGTYTSTSGDLTSSLGNSGSVSVDLTVSASLPGFSKSFSPASVRYGSRSTLTYIIDNSLNAYAVSSIDFTDQLPSGLVIANPANASTTCGTAIIPATLTAIAGTDRITLDANGDSSFPALAAGAVGTVTVDVVAESSGTLDCTDVELLADFVSAGGAGASLTVNDPGELFLRQSFVGDPAAPGSTNAALEITILNRSRDAAAADISFSMDLDAVLSGLAANGGPWSDVCGTGSILSGSSVLVLSGGALGAGASSTFRVPLQVPVSAASGSYSSATGAITGTIDGSAVSGSMSADTLFISAVPQLTMEFVNDTVVPGDTVTIRYTVENTSSSDATDISFIHELTDGSSYIAESGGSPYTGFLPSSVSVTLPPVPDPPCGIGSSLSLVSLGASRQGLELTGGSLAAGFNDSFTVTVTIPEDMPGGQYLSETRPISATAGGTTETGFSAADTLTVIAGPRLTKVFTDDPVAPGGTVTLEYTLSLADEASSAATNIAFTDDLSACLSGLAAIGLPIDDPCGEGSSLSGTTLLSFTGGTLSPGESCTFSVTLQVGSDSASGSYDSTTSEVSAEVAGFSTTSPSAADELSVSSLTFTKEFLNDPFIAGETGTVRYTIENGNPTNEATITFFSDSLSGTLSGLSVAGPVTQDTCGGSLSGTSTIIYTGGSVPGGQTALIDVPVLIPSSAADGAYPSVSGTLVASLGGSPVIVDPAADALTVQSTLLQLEMQFTEDSVLPGGTAVLELTLINLDAARTASGIAFSVDLDSVISGMTFESVVSNALGGTVSGITSSQISVSGVSLAGGESATLRVSLAVPAETEFDTYSFSSSALSGEISGLAVSGTVASDDLDVVRPVLFSTSFDGPAVAAGSAVLTFSLKNERAEAVSGLRFTVDLDSILPGLVAVNLPETPCGRGSSISGTSLLQFTGGQLAANGGTGTFDVELLVPASAPVGLFSASSSSLSADGIVVADPATASLVIVPPPTFSTTFSPDKIAYGQTSTLIFTIDNTASALAATGLNFTDNLPAGLTIASPANASSTVAGGTLTAGSGSGTISYTGGSVGAGASGIVQVDVSASALGILENTSGALTSSSGNSGTAADTLTVVKAGQTILFPTIGNQFTTNTVTLSATGGDSTNPVTFAVAAGPAILNGAVLSFTGAGSVSITAGQAGDANYNAASTVTNTFAVSAVSNLVTYADANSGSDSSDGLSWATAKQTIQAAVDLVGDGGTVWVTNGIYSAGGTTNGVIEVSANITVQSVNGAYETIIDGSNTARCVFLEAGTLSGFTLTNGYSSRGGGAYLDSGTLNNCILSGNTAVTSVFGYESFGGGGGAYLNGGTLNNCILSGNTAVTSVFGYSSDGGGGGAYLDGGTLNNCILTGNAAKFGGAVYSEGGGTLNNCTLSGNTADFWGGGAELYDSTLNNCTLSGNTADYGGGADLYAGSLLNNCTLSGNLASEGGGVYLDAGGMLNNCTLSGNTADTGGGSYSYNGGTLINCIVWDNHADSAADIYNNGGSILMTCASDGVTNGVNGCITSSPLFVSTNDFRLTASSPCINAGTNLVSSAGTDLAGSPRLVGASVDMGAFERQLVIDQDGPLAVTMSEDGSPIAWAAPALSVSAGDTNAVLTWSVSSAASNGTAMAAGTGVSPTPFTYAPAANYNGADQFVVQVADGTHTNTIAVNVTIEPVVDPAVVTLGSLAQTYTGSALAATATTSPTNLTVEFTYDGSASAPTNAGSYSVVGTVVDPVYTGSAAGTLVIARAVPAVSNVTAGAITYGTPLSGSALSGEGVAGTFAFDSPGLLPTVADSATTGYAFTFTPTDSVNYTDVSGTVTLVVNRKALTVTADDKTKVYGEANPPLTVSYSGWVNSEDVSVLDKRPTATCPADATSDAGTYAITPANGVAANYVFSYAPGSLTVTQAGQTVAFSNIGLQEVTNVVTLSASASSGLAVTNFSVVSGPAVVNGTQLSFTGAGAVELSAMQDGSVNYKASPATNIVFDVVGIITNVAPDNGTVFGGTEVVIDGLWLGDGTDITSVMLCGIEANIVSQSIHSVTVETGAAPPVETNGSVVVESGFGTVVMANAFTYRPVPLAPTALSAIDVTEAQFIARWVNNDETTTHYFIDVSTSTNFTAMTGMYSNWSAGDVTACLVTGLVDGVDYWYRVRAANPYGSGDSSNLIEVPVSTNTPYVKQIITNGIVSANSSDVLLLSDLFNGSGMSYAVISNSNPSLVSASIDAVDGTLTLDYGAGPGWASITVRCTDPGGFYVDSTVTVYVTDDQPTWSAGDISLNLANGLFEQTVSVTNTSAYDAQSVTLTVSDLSGGAALYNATGTDPDGNAEILWVGTLAAGETMDFTLQYAVSDLRVTPSATVSVSLSLATPDVELDENKAVTLAGTAQCGDTFVIAFETTIGKTYYIQYADDLLSGDWKTASPSITALTEKVQWVDSGPPVTDEPGDSRCYRVIQAD